MHVALVGAGGRGRDNARELLKLDDVRITTVIDPAEHWDLESFYYRGEAGRGPVSREIERNYREKEPAFTVRQASDFRRALPDGKNDFDAVVVATPDHLHALVSLAAMRAGKAVYCEKPLTHNIAEARLVARVARETGVATQMGNQGHSHDAIRMSIDLVRSGRIGTVSEVHAWVPATRWNKTLDRPPDRPQAVPAGLDWDLWCGPRRPVPFHQAYAPVTWRDFWEFGLGAMGDFGCHDLDAAVWGLDLGLPTAIEMRPAGQTDPGMIPYGELGSFDFPTGRQKSPVRIHWYSGGLIPPQPETMPPTEKLGTRGVLFVGDRGVVLYGNTGRQPRLYPSPLAEQPGPTEPTLRRSPGHHREWIDAVKGGPAAGSDFAYAAKLTEISLLGVLALRTGERIAWNADAMQVADSPTSESIVYGDYRAGWTLSES